MKPSNNYYTSSYLSRDLKELHMACLNDDIASLESLYLKGESLTGVDVDGYCSLHIAVKYHSKEAVKWLLAQRHDLIELVTDGGNNPLHIAAENEDIDMIILLLQHGADGLLKNRRCLSAVDILCNKIPEYTTYLAESEDLSNSYLLEFLETIKILEFED